jgi:hypothetical protein
MHNICTYFVQQCWYENEIPISKKPKKKKKKTKIISTLALLYKVYINVVHETWLSHFIYIYIYIYIYIANISSYNNSGEYRIPLYI